MNPGLNRAYRGGSVHLLYVLVVLSCSCRSGKPGPSALSRPVDKGAASPSKDVAGSLSVAARRPAGRHAVLGRVVDFGEMRATVTLADTPDEEISDPSADVAVLLSVQSRLSGFRLSSGRALWTSKVDAPCRHLVLAGRRVYSGCGDSLYSFGSDSGKQNVVDAGPDVRDPVLVDGGAVIASVHGDGRVSLYSAGADQKLASKALPEIARAMHPRVLAAPAGGGVCAIGLGRRSGRMAYRAGCYDRALEPLWTKWLPLKLTRDVQFEIAQLGPRYLVLDDQESVLDPSLPPGPGNGWLLRWKDGELTPFNGEAFATVESPDERPLTPLPDVFARTARLDSVASSGAPFRRREAEVVSTRDKAYAIVMNRAAGLAGVDRKSGRTLFLVPLRVGDIWSLEIIDGYPVVRTRFTSSWLATVHDPMTGAIVYRDERPRAPGR